ncbi:hypothetical protein ACQ4PT_010018 [Festuca glaucescens]
MEISSEHNGAYSGRDWLSDLPDCLLHTILSRLKARQVVQTCLLSQRWRHLWLDAPYLDIDTQDFPISYKRWRMRSRWFEDFVDNLLFHHSTRLLHTLRLGIDVNNYKVDDRCMPRWIRRGLDCAPAVLIVHHGTLITLPPGASSGTRRLTKLCLDQVTLHRDLDQQIATGMPVLEDLSFRNSDLGALSCITSGTLKNLSIDCCQNTGSSIAIAAPRLASLRFTILFYNHAGFIVAEAPSLVEASIRLVKKPHWKLCHWKLGSKPDMRMLRDLSKLLGSLRGSTVRSLKLTGFPKLLVGEKDVMFPVPHTDGLREAEHMWDAMHSDKFVICPMLHWILEEERHRLPLFGNLRTLTLDNCQAGDKIQVLRCFLHNTPVLEMLTLNNCKVYSTFVI